MRIISRKRLLDFSKIHSDAFTPLDNWYRISKSASWRNLEEVKQTLPTAESVGKFTVFNIKGNTYRLIVDIDYQSQIIFVRYTLTHSEYDKDRWKNAPHY